MTDVPLTPRLSAKLASLFRSEDRSFAEQWLIQECSDERELERVRAAALKVSEGSLDTLAKATALGQMDYRDLLMVAGFGSDAHAHEAWLAEPNYSN